MNKSTGPGLRRLRASIPERATLATGIQIALLTSGMLQMVWSDARAQAIGELTGRITDSTGLLLGDLPIHVEEIPACDDVRAGHRQTCREWRTQSGYQGAFYVGQLPAGTYRVTIALGAFQPYEQVIRIQAGLNEFMDVVVQLRGEEEIRVEIPAAIVQPAPGGSVDLLGTTFARKDIESSTLSSGRTLQTFQRLVPGIVFTDSIGTLAQFTTLGQRRFSNRLTIDGVNADLAADVRRTGVEEAASGALPVADVSGSSQAVVSLEAVDQIQIRTTNASPEFARSAGAQTSIVTRAGGDRLAGSAVATFRPDGLSARTWFERVGEVPPRRSSLWNGGLSLGGPIASGGRLRGFATVDRQLVNRSVQTTILVPSQQTRDAASAVLRPVLDAFPSPDGPDNGDGLAQYAGEFPARSSLLALSARLDTVLSESVGGFVRVHHSGSSGDQLTERNQMPFLSHVREETTHTTSATAATTWRWRNVLFNDTRANFTSHKGQIVAMPGVGGAARFPFQLVRPNEPDETWVQLTVFPGPNGSISAGRATANALRQIQLAHSASATVRSHDIRFGGDYSRVDVSGMAAPYRYNYAFAGVDQFLRAQARLLTAQYAPPWDATRQRWALFAQDRARISPRISLDYGIRYSGSPAPSSKVPPGLVDFDRLPELVLRASDGAAWRTAHRFAPSLQMAYQRGDLLLRTGLSTVFDEQTSPGIAPFSDGYPFLATRAIAAPDFPATRDDLPPIQTTPLTPEDRTTYYSFPSTLRPARVHQWNISFDRAIKSSHRLSLAYVGSASRDLVRSYIQSVPSPLLLPVVRVYANDADASYHALLLRYSVSVARGFQAKLDYTWSHSIDTDSGESIGRLPPPSISDLALSRGSSDFDRTHLVQFTASYSAPTWSSGSMLATFCSDWRMDAIATYVSGGPFSAEVLGQYRLRLDVIEGVPQWLDDPSVLGGRRVNPAAFKAPPPTRQGTLGRNALRAAPLAQMDLSLSRRVRIHGGVVLTARASAFNVFNAATPGPPVRLSGDSQFGRPIGTYADSLGAGSLAYGGLVPLLQAGAPRAIHFDLRLGF